MLDSSSDLMYFRRFCAEVVSASRDTDVIGDGQDAHQSADHQTTAFISRFTQLERKLYEIRQVIAAWKMGSLFSNEFEGIAFPLRFARPAWGRMVWCWSAFHLTAPFCIACTRPLIACPDWPLFLVLPVQKLQLPSPVLAGLDFPLHLSKSVPEMPDFKNFPFLPFFKKN
jgi:hypothetical protein